MYALLACFLYLYFTMYEGRETNEGATQAAYNTEARLALFDDDTGVGRRGGLICTEAHEMGCTILHYTDCAKTPLGVAVCASL